MPRRRQPRPARAPSGAGLALLAALLLAACETTPEPPAASEDAGAERAAAETAETAALPPEPEIDDDPAQLIGMAPGGLRELLGEPNLMRRENPAQVWQYRGATCVLDLVLYSEAGSDRVTYVEARDRAGAGSETRACLNALLRARLEPSG